MQKMRISNFIKYLRKFVPTIIIVNNVYYIYLIILSLHISTYLVFVKSIFCNTKLHLLLFNMYILSCKNINGLY
jgi:hypothetical protein